MDHEQARLRMAYELERASAYLKDLDRLNAQVGSAMTEDVDQAMRARAARLEASGQIALARAFLAAWEALGRAASARARRHDQVAADTLDDAIEAFERAWGETQTWLERQDS